jgi:hypothetical protein
MQQNELIRFGSVDYGSWNELLPQPAGALKMQRIQPGQRRKLLQITGWSYPQRV